MVPTKESKIDHSVYAFCFVIHVAIWRYNKNIVTVKRSWPASCSTFASHHRTVVNNGKQLLTTGSDRRIPFKTVDNTCGVVALG